jgi:hypothetical protein
VLTNGFKVYRRSLSDVKFGVVANETIENTDKTWLENVLLGQSDLITGIYEGVYL